jgi:hypothetical protein
MRGPGCGLRGCVTSILWRAGEVMKILLFLMGCAGVTVGVMYTLEMLPAMSAGNFALDQYRDQAIYAGVGGVIALICFGKALGGKKEPTME